MNLYSFFRNRPNWNKNRLFLRDLHAKQDYSYGDLDLWTARIASQLVNRFGVRPGDRVAVQVEKSPQAYFLYLACLRVGAIYLPLNSAYKSEEIDFFLCDANPTVFVCDPIDLEVMSPICKKVGAMSLTLDSSGQGSLLEDLERQSEHIDTLNSNDSDLAAILYTSGTTGRSKGAMLSHGNLISNATALTQAWGFTHEDILLHTLPIFHVHGLFISLHCTLSSSSSVYWLPKFDAPEIIKYLKQVSVFMGVPTYYTRLLDTPEFQKESCQSIRLFVSGSAPLREETFQLFYSRIGHQILERYGMTETGVNTSNPLNEKRVPGTVGLPLPGVDIRFSGDQGMIEVRGPNVFQGYWGQPEKTQSEFTSDGYFLTGDLGFRDDQGYVTISGRSKDLIISGGFNIYPKEIELVLDAIAGVLESAVIGVPHPDFGEAVVAVIVKEKSSVGEGLQEQEIISFMKKNLAAFKAPKRVFFLDALPRNTMGKVQKASLRQTYQSLFE